ncbi:MAG: hypothetical protein ACOVJ8_08855 [Sediminibacterium sp.]
MASRNQAFRTPSWTSPKTNQRGCVCPDGTYSTKCCDGSLQAQGIGNIYRKGETFYLLLENSGHIQQENQSLIKLENG